MTDFDEIRQQMDLLSDEELLSIIEEHDEDQWRPEVFDIVRVILSQRGVSVDENTVPVPDTGMADEPPEEGLALVASYFSRMDAEVDRLALASKGIDSWIVDRSAVIPSGVELKVRESDLRTAIALVDPDVLNEAVPSSDLPEDIAEPPCPKCGSRNVTESAETLYDPPGQEWVYRCASCGHKWSET